MSSAPTGPIALLLLLHPAAVSAQRTPVETSLPEVGYELIAERAGVRAYKHTDGDMIRIGAEGRLAAPPDSVREALLDYRDQVGKIGRLSETEVLESGDNWLFVYQRLNLPVISDRDYNLYVHWGDDGGLTYIVHQAVESVGPGERDGVVRVVRHTGSWQLLPIEDGRATYARFQASIDLGGWLPMWLARAEAGKELPDLFRDVRAMLAEREKRRMACSSSCP